MPEREKQPPRRCINVFSKRFRIQFATCLIVNIIVLFHGINIGWVSPSLIVLTSPTETPLSFHLDIEETSWVGAVYSIGCMTGNLAFGLSVDYMGRKFATHLLAIPGVMCWILVYWAENKYWLYGARLCAGFTGGASFVVIPVFISEITEAHVRGRFALISTISCAIGILIAYIICAYLPYHTIPIIVMPLPCLHFIASFLYPETPQYLIRRNKLEKAKKSLRFYRNLKANSTEDEAKLNRIFAEMYGEYLENKLRKEEERREMLEQGIKSHFCNTHYIKAMSISICLCAGMSFCGLFTIVCYMSYFFEDPHLNTIIVGAVNVGAVCLTSEFIDRLGRRKLLMISYGGMGAGLATFSVYLLTMSQWAKDISLMVDNNIRLGIMVCITFMGNLGIIPITQIVVVETLPVKIRSFGSSLCFAVMNMLTFGIMKAFPPLVFTFGLGWTLFFNVFFCAVEFIFVMFVVKETMGKSMQID